MITYNEAIFLIQKGLTQKLPYLKKGKPKTNFIINWGIIK